MTLRIPLNAMKYDIRAAHVKLAQPDKFVRIRSGGTSPLIARQSNAL